MSFVQRNFERFSFDPQWPMVKSSYAPFPHMGLSENSVPLNSLVNHYPHLYIFDIFVRLQPWPIAMTAMTEVPEVLPNMQTSDVDRDDKTNIMRLETQVLREKKGTCGILRAPASRKLEKTFRSMCLLHGTWQDWICEFELICPLVTSSYGMSMNVTMSDRQIIYSWAIFYSYVRLPEGITMHDLDPLMANISPQNMSLRYLCNVCCRTAHSSHMRLPWLTVS